MQIGSPATGEPILFPVNSRYNVQISCFLSFQVMLD